MSPRPRAHTPLERFRTVVRERIWQNSSRVHLDRFACEAGRSLRSGARVLDAGAGDAPYRTHFGHTRYETADFCQVEKAYAPVDYVCDLADIPVEAARYEAVLLTQVLEHVPEPQRVLRELFRILTPGGRLWLTAPLFYAEHEQPHDYYRYTSFGFRHQLSSAGFEVEHISWLEGYAGTVSYQLKEAVLKLPHSPVAYGGGLVGGACMTLAFLFRLPLFAFSSLLAAADVRHRHVTSGQCKNYQVIALKPPTSARVGDVGP